jgi:hypothetical protein
VSLQTKIRDLVAFQAAHRLPRQEQRFMADLRHFLPPGQVEALSPRQLLWLEHLWARYCEH